MFVCLSPSWNFLNFKLMKVPDDSWSSGNIQGSFLRVPECSGKVPGRFLNLIESFLIFSTEQLTRTLQCSACLSPAPPGGHRSPAWQCILIIIQDTILILIRQKKTTAVDKVAFWPVSAPAAVPHGAGGLYGHSDQVQHPDGGLGQGAHHTSWYLRSSYNMRQRKICATSVS